jgi:hypothetical protein
MPKTPEEIYKWLNKTIGAPCFLSDITNETRKIYGKNKDINCFNCGLNDHSICWQRLIEARTDGTGPCGEVITGTGECGPIAKGTGDPNAD